MDMRARLTASVEESIAVKQAILASLLSPIMTAADWMTAALYAGHKLLLFGNGGSAADAQHIAAEFVGRFEKERRAWPAIALTTDTSILTALGNDYGIDVVFARQIEALGQPGDVVLAFSTSGNSPNVLEGVKAARAKGLRVIGFTGADGGKLAPLCDLALRVPSRRTARIQEGYMVICHALCEVTEAALLEA
jgi:D-sedoheptulose 7-phosphate isomerase